MSDASPLPLSSGVYEAVERAARAERLSIPVYLAKIVTEHFEHHQKRSKTVTVSATINTHYRPKLNELVKARQIRMAEFVRSVVLTAIETGDFPPACEGDTKGGMPVSARFTQEIREKLGQIAESKAVTVSELVTALIMAEVRKAA